jgi:hypothetical protein
MKLLYGVGSSLKIGFGLRRAMVSLRNLFRRRFAMLKQTNKE